MRGGMIDRQPADRSEAAARQSLRRPDPPPVLSTDSALPPARRTITGIPDDIDSRILSPEHLGPDRWERPARLPPGRAPRSIRGESRRGTVCSKPIDNAGAGSGPRGPSPATRELIVGSHRRDIEENPRLLSSAPVDRQTQTSAPSRRLVDYFASWSLSAATKGLNRHGSVERYPPASRCSFSRKPARRKDRVRHAPGIAPRLRCSARAGATPPKPTEHE